MIPRVINLTNKEGLLNKSSAISTKSWIFDFYVNGEVLGILSYLYLPL